jgi:RecA/RadA recombinase
VCAFIDAEHEMDPLYAKQIGVDIDEEIADMSSGRRAGAGPGYRIVARCGSS